MPPVVSPSRPATGTVATPSTSNALPHVPARSTADGLKNLLNANWNHVATGTPPTITKAGAKWLMTLAQNPAADASVKSAIAAKANGVAVSPKAPAGFAAFVTGLAAPATPATPATPTTPAAPTTPGINRPVGGTVGTGGSLMDWRLGFTGTVTDIPHFKGPTTFDGPWKLAPGALAKYSDVKLDKFGATDVQAPGGGTYSVRDFHYDVGGGKVGMRLVPVSDSGEVTDVDGKKVPGSKVMDDFLRKQMNLGPDEPIYALIAYIHPEGHDGTLQDLAGSMLKTEGGNTHLGAYTGGGRTTNSPETYHNNVWEVGGYPAQVQVVSLEGVPQGTLNQNAIIADTLLNKGVKFPPDYKNDLYQTLDLKTTLEFYKKWVRDDPALKTDPKWFTYCAEHKTIVTNVMLNVPHNEKAFKEIWGDAEGAKLFGEVKEKFKAISGKDMPETSFEPLYKKEGIADPAKETGFGRGLAWPAETTPDIMEDFMQTYANFRDVGGVVQVSMLAGFMNTIKERTGVSEAEYMKLAMPFMNTVMVAEAKTQQLNTPADLQKWSQQTAAALYVGLGGKKEDFAPGGTIDPARMGLAKGTLAGVEAAAPDILANHGLSRDKAEDWLLATVKPEVDKMRQTPVGDPTRPQYFSPPNITTRIINGVHEHSRFVDIKTVATAMDAEEVQPK